MATAVLDLAAAKPAPAFRPVPAAAVRLIVRASFGVVVLGLAVVAIGPRIYPFQGYYVRSASMAPTIPVGAMLIVTRVSADELGRGDVIVFERPDRAGMMVVHRIDAVEETPSGRAFITRGDANSTPDAWRVPASGEGWRAVYSVPRAGFIVGWLHVAMSRQGWLAAFAIIAAVCALVAIWTAEEP
jgi:signal peptidase I